MEHPDNKPITATNDNIIAEPESQIETEHYENNDTLESVKNPQKYHYIKDQQLQKLFGHCINHTNTPLNIYFCIYNMNSSCFIEGLEKEDDIVKYTDLLPLFNNIYPFLEYIVEKTENNTYCFPKMVYECPFLNKSLIGGSSEDDDEPEKSEYQIHFENECMKHVLSLFDENESLHSSMPTIDNLYKGFIENSDNTIFVFFDTTSVKARHKPQYIKAIIDEILFKQMIYSTPVDPVVWKLFLKYKFLRAIKNAQGYELPCPFQLYMCKIVNDEFANFTINDLQYQPFSHQLGGTAYYFTTDPLSNTENVDQLMRYACYIVKCLYIEKDIDTELDDEDKHVYSDQILAASTVYFQQSGIQFWAVKNILHFCDLEKLRI